MEIDSNAKTKMIRPLSTRVLLEAVPYKPSLNLNIVVPETYVPDRYEWRVVACGSKVSFDIKPGVRVVVDPTLLNQCEFEYQGRKFKSVEAKDMLMVIGVPNE